jgi:putative FmdB family regulatory protein
MPIYEYRCQKCGNLSEYLVGVGDDDPIECKHCGSSEMSRIAL